MRAQLLNHVAAGAALLGLGALALWMPTALLERTVFFDGATRHDPDYYIENFTATALNEQGVPKHTLRGHRLTHFPDDQTTEIIRPDLTQFSADSPPIRSRAALGYLSPDGKVLRMVGEVRVARSASATDPGGVVTAREMHIELE